MMISKVAESLQKQFLEANEENVLNVLDSLLERLNKQKELKLVEGGDGGSAGCSNNNTHAEQLKEDSKQKQAKHNVCIERLKTFLSFRNQVKPSPKANLDIKGLKDKVSDNVQLKSGNRDAKTPNTKSNFTSYSSFASRKDNKIGAVKRT